MAMLDGDYEDVNPETTMGNLLFAKQIHRFLKHPEHLLNLEEVRSVLLDYLQQLFEQNKQVCTMYLRAIETKFLIDNLYPRILKLTLLQ